MKNSIQRFIVVLLFFIQGTTLIGQTSIDQLYLGLRYIPTVNVPYLYISGIDNVISIRKKSDLKFSFNRKIKTLDDKVKYDEFYSSYLRYGWNGNISNFTLGYSPIPHLYGTANLFVASEREGRRLYDSQIIIGGIGIGGYILKEPKNISKKISKWKMPDRGLLVNALVGYNRGKISLDEYYRIGSGKFFLNQFYGKIGLDYQARLWGIATNVRFGVLNFGTTKLQGHAYEELILQRELLTKQNDFLFGELSCRVYLGMKFGQLYINGIVNKVNAEMSRFVLSDILSVGAVLSINKIFKKKIKNEE